MRAQVQNESMQAGSQADGRGDAQSDPINAKVEHVHVSTQKLFYYLIPIKKNFLIFN